MLLRRRKIKTLVPFIWDIRSVVCYLCRGEVVEEKWMRDLLSLYNPKMHRIY